MNIFKAPNLIVRPKRKVYNINNNINNKRGGGQSIGNELIHTHRHSDTDTDTHSHKTHTHKHTHTHTHTHAHARARARKHTHTRTHKTVR